jgi:mycobactin phenyloxazoline synthetase
MSVEALLKEVSARGASLRAVDGELRIRAAPGALDAHLKQQLKAMKRELLDALGSCAPTSASAEAEPPMTALQEAYWIGERPFYRQSVAACFAQDYVAPTFDARRAEKALARLIERYDALRMSVNAEGILRFAATGGPQNIQVEDLRQHDSEEIELLLQQRFGAVDAQLASLEEGQPFFCRAFQVHAGFRIQLAVRLFYADAGSLAQLFREFAALYGDPNYVYPQSSASYRAYLTAVRDEKYTKRYRAAERYWSSRLQRLPPAPDLPKLERGQRAGADGAFQHIEGTLDPETWKLLQERCREEGVTPNALLFTVYCKVIQRWAAQPTFTMNVMGVYRPQSSTARELVGNCSSTCLVVVDDHGGSMREEIERTQSSLIESISRMSVPGVELIRRLQHQEPSAEPKFPVVFTSGIGLADPDNGFSIPVPEWRLRRSLLKTPQVWLDHQVYEERERLILNWDFMPSVYRVSAMEAMFAQYGRSLRELAHDAAAWNRRGLGPLRTSELAARRESNATAREITAVRLESDFDRVARARPHDVALIHGQTSTTYGQLRTEVLHLASQLSAKGVRDESRVVVCLPRGKQQIVSVLATLFAGGVYVPVDVSTPEARVRHIINHSEACCLISDHHDAMRWAKECGVAHETGTLQLASAAHLPGPMQPAAATEKLAYVIYTSGSTGTPKGVALQHGAASNTIQDVLSRFAIGSEDTFIALSSLAFDLSVFDIFGALSVGAKLVLPPPTQRPDPDGWAQLVLRHKVTVWNSVPALMDITCETQDEELQALRSLRKILLSGDWIGIPLAQRLRRRLPDASLVALGGATEAAIWSNFHVVGRVHSDWSSVPYGRPLANQSMHILDEYLEERPNWTVGDLYIGGKGLAREYFRDDVRTRESFIVDRARNERLYRTGDQARWWPDGTIEFLGRTDFQVKLRGFRVELGEVEAALLAHPQVQSCVALVLGEKEHDRTLTAALVPHGDVDLVELTSQVAQRLPSYMVPTFFLCLDELPLSANGKVDRSSLSKMMVQARTSAPAPEARDLTPTEERVAAIWSTLLPGRDLTSVSNFFDAGGNSLLAVRLMMQLRRTFGVELPLGSLFAHSTVAAQAQLLLASPSDPERHCTVLRKGDGPYLYLVHPVGGDVLCYRELLGSLDPSLHVVGVRASRTPKPGDCSLDEMAESYARELPTTKEPSWIAGWSMGGVLAAAMSRHAQQQGVAIAGVVAIDSWVAVGQLPAQPRFGTVAAFLNDLTNGGGEVLDLPYDAPPDQQLRLGLQRLRELHVLPPTLEDGVMGQLWIQYRSHAAALMRGSWVDPHAPVHCVTAARSRSVYFDALRPLVNSLRTPPHSSLVVQADHYGVVSGAAAREVASFINLTIMRANHV